MTVRNWTVADGAFFTAERRLVGVARRRDRRDDRGQPVQRRRARRPVHQPQLHGRRPQRAGPDRPPPGRRRASRPRAPPAASSTRTTRSSCRSRPPPSGSSAGPTSTPIAISATSQALDGQRPARGDPGPAGHPSHRRSDPGRLHRPDPAGPPVGGDLVRRPRSRSCWRRSAASACSSAGSGS